LHFPFYLLYFYTLEFVWFKNCLNFSVKILWCIIFLNFLAVCWASLNQLFQILCQAVRYLHLFRDETLKNKSLTPYFFWWYYVFLVVFFFFTFVIMQWCLHIEVGIYSSLHCWIFLWDSPSIVSLSRHTLQTILSPLSLDCDNCCRHCSAKAYPKSNTTMAGAVHIEIL
jgi:hypothetical protein